MGRTGNRRDNGNTRRLHTMNRVQLHFDDLFDNEFQVGIPKPLESDQGAVKIRFGSRTLADHLANSTVSSAIVDPESETAGLDYNQHAPPGTSAFGEDLQSLFADTDVGETFNSSGNRTYPATSADTPTLDVPITQANAHWLPPVFDESEDNETESSDENLIPDDDAFSFRGLIGGFLIGAAITATALILLKVFP